VDTKSGIDISNHQGPPEIYRAQQWYIEAEFVVAQAIPRPAPDGYTAQQLRAAREDGKATAIYTWLHHDPTWRLSPNVRDDQLRRLATVPDDHVPDGRPWLDVEDNVSTGWANVSVAQRVEDVNIALDTLDEWARDRGLLPAGIYWSQYYIDLLFGGVDYFSRTQWRAHYIGPSGWPAPGSLIGGLIVGHQWTSSPVDKNVFLASEFQASPEPEDPIVGLQNALAYVCDTIGDDIWKRTRSPAIRADVTEMRRVRRQFMP
jgi:hypothetical protein